jgi:hypothetical protein
MNDRLRVNCFKAASCAHPGRLSCRLSLACNFLTCLGIIEDRTTGEFVFAAEAKTATVFTLCGVCPSTLRTRLQFLLWLFCSASRPGPSLLIVKLSPGAQRWQRLARGAVHHKSSEYAKGELEVGLCWLDLLMMFNDTCPRKKLLRCRTSI